MDESVKNGKFVTKIFSLIILDQVLKSCKKWYLLFLHRASTHCKLTMLKKLGFWTQGESSSADVKAVVKQQEMKLAASL